MSDYEAGRIALVHDYMTQLGGAERVAGILARELDGARLLTSVHLPREVPLRFIGNRPWSTSYLQPLAGRVPLKSMLFALPGAMASLEVGDCGLVVSSSSAFAHHVRAPREALHVCYCSAPAHFLWNQDEYFRGRSWEAVITRPALNRLRRLDQEAAARVDLYLANSKYTATRIHQTYGRTAEVVYPPVELSRFQPSGERSGRFLVLSRLVPTKRVELVVAAANHLGLPLDVIGKGPELQRLRKRAGSSVRVLGWQPDQVVRRAIAECTALVVAGVEDFGMVMVEAQASGRPPVAFAAGGSLEIIEEGSTGFLFEEQAPEAIGEAMLRAAAHDLDPHDLVASARRFDTSVFLDAFHGLLNRGRSLVQPAPAEVTSIASREAEAWA